MNSRIAQSRSAFTLLEVLIAIAIFTGVVAAIYAVWSSILRSTRVAHAAAVEVQRERVAVRAIEEALFSLQFFQENQRYYSFLADTSSEFAGLSFVSRLPDSYPRSGNFEGQPLRRVTFTVEPHSGGGNALMLRQNPVLFETSLDEAENPLVLARHLRAFSLEFWGPRSVAWEPEWLFTNQIPKLIRFTLGFGPADPRSTAQARLATRVVVLNSTGIPAALQRSAAAGLGGPGQGGRTNIVR